MKIKLKSRHLRTVAVVVSLLLLAVLFFWPWFAPGVLGYGDWVFNLPKRINDYWQHLLIWDGAVQLGTSLSTGAPNNILIYWLAWLMSALQALFYIPVSVSTRLIWFLPYIIFAFSGGAWLGWQITKRRIGALIGALLYSLSTFGLLTVQGGQMTVAISYALAPFTVLFFIRLWQEQKWALALWLAIAGWGQTIYDVRILYISIWAIIFYVLFDLWSNPQSRSCQYFKPRLTLSALAGVLYVLLNSYWLIPILLSNTIYQAGLPADYDSVSWLSTLSYATLNHGLATTHVWWPWSEGVMNPIPFLFYSTSILAVLGLWWGKKKPLVIYFTLIWLIGVFLLKGINPPAGEIYEWLFVHVPGFSLFRDPAKFFTLSMLGMVPAATFGAVGVVDRVQRKGKPFVLSILVLLLLIPPLKVALTSRHGTFIPKQIPSVYYELQDWFKSQEAWGRVMWLPRVQRYVLPSQEHPSIDGRRLTEEAWRPFTVGGTGQTAAFFDHPYAPWLLDQAGVSWLGLPDDTEDELYKYDLSYDQWNRLLRRRSWITPLKPPFNNISLFSNPGAKREIYSGDEVLAVEERALPFLAGTNAPQPENDALLYTFTEPVLPAEILPSLHGQLFNLHLNTEELQSNPFTWSFNLQKGSAEPLQLDSAFFGHVLKLDGQVVNSELSGSGRVRLDNPPLEPGEHQIEALPSQDLMVVADRAEREWKACPATAATTITVDNDATLVEANDPGTYACARIEVGTVTAGVYELRLQSTYTYQLFITGYDLTKEEPEVLFHRGYSQTDPSEQAFRFIIDGSHPLTLEIIGTPGPDITLPAVTRVSALSISQLFQKSPSWLYVPFSSAKSASPSIVDFKKQSPRDYSVTLPASTEPYWLVLNQAYAPAWQIKGSALSNHIPANGGLNAWLIPAGAEREVEITYGPLYPFWVGLCLTVVTLIIITIALKKSARRNK